MKDEKTRFIEYDLICLWDSLWKALERSLSGDPERPSAEMEDIMGRIVWATSLVGPISWKEINLKALKTGRYEYWAKYMGIEYSMPPKEELAELQRKRRMWHEHLRGTGSSV